MGHFRPVGHGLALLACALCCSCGGGGTASPSMLQIMPLGDSITAGTGMVPGGYREMFDQDLYPKYRFRFVGTLSYESDGMRSPWHEGHSGWSTLDFVGGTVVAGRPKFPASAFVAKAKPDVIVFHLGTNDGVEEPEMEKRYNDCLTAIYSVAPKVKIVWALCLWKKGGNQVRLITATHDAANAVAKVWQAKGKQIVVVDPSVGFDPVTMTEDGTHPTSQGYRLLTDAIEKGFEQIMTNP